MKEVLNKIALNERISLESLEEKINKNSVVVPLNIKREHIEKPVAIGEGLKVKVNANIGASPDISDLSFELKKLNASIEAGTDTVMDLTIGKNWEEMLSLVIERSSVPVGTVPVYGILCSGKSIDELKSSDFINIIEKQAKMGVDFMTVHSGVTERVKDIYEDQGRLGGIVSRGGKLIYRWMKKTGQENPLYEAFDEIMDIAKEYRVTLSLGDGLRPGSIKDASDEIQYSELKILGELTKRCHENGVSVMIEGPGHVPLNKIKENIMMEKELCAGAPFYILGPLPTDIAAGHDHITGAIGGAFAAWMGADFLCYLTPAEHLHLPDEDDVYKGVMASKIAAHVADIARGIPGAEEIDHKMSQARRDLNWDMMENYALDPKAIRETRKKFGEREDGACTMCSEYCALIEPEES